VPSCTYPLSGHLTRRLGTLCFSFTLPGSSLLLLHTSAAPRHLLPHGSHSCSAALPPSRCSWLHALSLPSAPSLPLAAAPSDPPSRSTTASVADDPSGVRFGGDERGGSCMAFPYRFPSSPHGIWISRYFWLGIGDALLPASTLSPRRHLKNTD
jgi:hypothetical protein